MSSLEFRARQERARAGRLARVRKARYERRLSLWLIGVGIATVIMTILGMFL